jgi:lipoyl-dependent peroxiredoxin
MAIRTANAEWKGDLRSGTGSFGGASGQLGGAYSFESRFTDSGGTNPEELVAAAHASCYAMALSNVLAKGGHAPEELDVSATATFDVGLVKITTMVLDVRGRVPGLDDAGFQQATQEAELGCPVSNALRGNVDVQVNATLAG